MSKEGIKIRIEGLKKSPVGLISKQISDDRRAFEKQAAAADRKYRKSPVVKGLRAIQRAMATA